MSTIDSNTSDQGTSIPQTPRRATVGGRGSGFSGREVNALLATLRVALPVGMEEWAEVAREHAGSFPTENRTAESLRRKFASLCRSSVPTGNASCPSEVREAKRIKHLIIERTDMSTGEDAAEVVASAFDSEDILGDIIATPPCATTATSVSMGTAASVTTTSSATTGTSSVGYRPPTSPSAPSSRPLVAVRSNRNSSDDDLIQLLRMQLLQGQEDERRRREAEEFWRERRLHEREEERERQERQLEREREMRAEERREREEEREREREMRAEERREREKKRAEERQWRQNMMHMMMMMLGKNDN